MTGRHEAEDLYNILGVAANVSPERIKEQFRFLVQAFHPDKHASPSHKARAEEMLRKVTEAYRILSDPLQRSAYDRRRASNSSQIAAATSVSTSDVSCSALSCITANGFNATAIAAITDTASIADTAAITHAVVTAQVPALPADVSLRSSLPVR